MEKWEREGSVRWREERVVERAEKTKRMQGRERIYIIEHEV